MKDNTLQQLLAKYQQGTLTGEELEQLNMLTHKDEVLGAAESRARTIIRRRTWREVGFVCAGLVLIGAGIWVMNPVQEAPMVAELNNNEIQPVEEIVSQEEVDAPMQKVSPKVASVPVSKKSQSTAQIAASQKEDPIVEDIVVAPLREEPTVVCNNQCDADSVINDIWKFLTA